MKFVFLVRNKGIILTKELSVGVIRDHP